VFVLLKDSQNTRKPMSDHFLEFHKECGDTLQVRWTNLQPSGVAFP